MTGQGIWTMIRLNSDQDLNNRDGQTNSVQIYIFFELQKAFNRTLDFNYRGPLLRAFTR